MGGCAIDATGNPLPDETLAACETADAVLLGAVGGPKWVDPTAAGPPGAGAARGCARTSACSPTCARCAAYPALAGHAPLRAELLDGVDILFVRELTGGIYFGERHEQGDGDRAWDTMFYTVDRGASAWRAWPSRPPASGASKVTSVDKANVLAVDAPVAPHGQRGRGGLSRCGA